MRPVEHREHENQKGWFARVGATCGALALVGLGVAAYLFNGGDVLAEVTYQRVESLQAVGVASSDLRTDRGMQETIDSVIAETGTPRDAWSVVPLDEADVGGTAVALEGPGSQCLLQDVGTGINVACADSDEVIDSGLFLAYFGRSSTDLNESAQILAISPDWATGLRARDGQLIEAVAPGYHMIEVARDDARSEPALRWEGHGRSEPLLVTLPTPQEVPEG